jgi:hypothetical protein
VGFEKAHGDAASHFSDSASSFASLFCFPWLLSTSRLAVESLLAAPADACGRSSAVLRYLVSKGGQAPGPKRRNLNVQQLDVDRRVEGEGWPSSMRDLQGYHAEGPTVEAELFCPWYE